MTSDAHAGLVEAIAANLPGAAWQRCRTHQPFTFNQARADAFAPWIEHYNTGPIHSSHGLMPAARVSPT